MTLAVVSVPDTILPRHHIYAQEMVRSYGDNRSYFDRDGYLLHNRRA